ncbi:MAG: U32 family peptidase [Oscillospiraceae bacterium]|nr:U32 family peptidase [Oscillospiraceae bacterium]
MNNKIINPLSKLELLSPAGDSERLAAAVDYGADAVYLGGQAFTMRYSPKNFNFEELKAAVEFSHSRGVKVYVTCNALPRNNEIPRFEQFIKEIEAAGADAAIIADLGLLSLLKKYAPSLKTHMSTQTGTVNYEAARTLYNMGAQRVILARELSLDEIAEIRAKTPPELELEAFVHGAMCVSFSGRCLLSQYLTGRDANRGDCAQPCRWSYVLAEEKRPGQFFPVREDESGSYILNSKDLCAIEILDKIAEAGVTSFKIEGRAKSAYYTAIITNAYRMALDILKKEPCNYILPDWVKNEVFKVSHREYCTGFFLVQGEARQNYETGGYIREYDVIAVIEECKDGRAFASLRNKFNAGDEVEIVSPGVKFDIVTINEIVNEKGEVINSAPHAMMKFSFPCEKNYPRNSIIRKKRELSP